MSSLFFFPAYPLSGMITVPVSAGTYQAVVASMQPGGGITFQSATEALTGSAGNAIQLIGTPLQLANGQIIGKVWVRQNRTHSNIGKK